MVPRLPLAVRLGNRLGRTWRALGLPLGTLDSDALLAAARAETGLGDAGDPGFRAGLDRLVEALEHEARLTPLGRVIARRDLVRLLADRLRHVDLRRQHPEIDRERVERPIFILGLPRTGTSILHELLAQDPRNRVPMTWEVMFPFPPPESATYATDPRIARTEEHFAGIDRLLPDFKRMHPMGALLPQECTVLTQTDFASMVWHTSNRVPSYEAWFESLDQRPVYEGHRRWLQTLQWKAPAQRWVLKSPQHLWALEGLLAVYPDARLVQTHRDPVKVAASLASLVCTLRSLGSDDVDPREIGRDWSARLAAGLEHAMAVRDRAGLPEGRVLDVGFRDFMADEIGTIRRIYEHFGLTLEPGAEHRMRAFLAANRADKHGAHRYDLASAGLEESRERRRFAAYSERYGVPAERFG